MTPYLFEHARNRFVKLKCRVRRFFAPPHSLDTIYSSVSVPLEGLFVGKNRWKCVLRFIVEKFRQHFIAQRRFKKAMAYGIVKGKESKNPFAVGADLIVRRMDCGLD